MAIYIFLSACSSVPKSDSNYYSFNEALEIGIQKIENDLPEGSDIAILDFKSNNPNLSSYMIEELYDILINGGKLSVMERSRTDIIKMEVGYQLSGEVDDSQIISIGKQLGANYVVTGEITFSGEAYRLRVFAIDIEKGRRVASSSLNINPNDKQVNYLITLINDDDKLKGFISVETTRGPSIGNISVVTGSLELSVLTSCLVSFDFGNLPEQVKLPSGGTIPINNINPGFYYIQLEYNDYVIQDIGFNILPSETTKISSGYRSGTAPYFPPVSRIQPVNVTNVPDMISTPAPENCIWGIGVDKDRYTAEKNAYVSIARQLSTNVTGRADKDIDGLLIWEEVFYKTENISGIASVCEIIIVFYDQNTEIYWVIAELSKSNAINILAK
jgi:TolB-like protein